MADFGTGFIPTPTASGVVGYDYVYEWILRPDRNEGDAFIPNMVRVGDTNFYFDIQVVAGIISWVYTGTEWKDTADVKVYTGTQWVTYKGNKVYNGTEWVEI